MSIRTRVLICAGSANHQSQLMATNISGTTLLPTQSIPSLKLTGVFMQLPARSPEQCAQVLKCFVVLSRTLKTSLNSRRQNLTMPMLVLPGEKASGTFLIEQAR